MVALRAQRKRGGQAHSKSRSSVDFRFLALPLGLIYKCPMLDYMQKGGPLMWLILLCSIVSVAVMAERLLYLHRATINVAEFLQGLSNLIRSRNFAEARIECQAASVPITRVIHAAILRHNLSRQELREIVQEAGQLEVPRLERNLGILVAIGYVAPLIGLLGTVTGLIQAFVQLSANNGYATLPEVSAGIYQSLLTTAAGLVVAISTIVGYCYLSSRVTAMLHDMERAGIEVVHLLTETAAETSIIEFEPPSQASSDRR
jgi:biopolymer transport protein ExbB